MAGRAYTIILETQLVTNASGLDVPDGPEEWRDATVLAGGAYVASIGTDAITLVDLTPGGGPNRTLIGTGTQGALDAFQTFHGADCKTGPEAVADGQLAGFLRARTRGGNRLVRGVRLIGEAVDISFVSPHVIAGQDPIDVALPDGVTRDQIELDEEVP